jgi:hypothetical protein
VHLKCFGNRYVAKLIFKQMMQLASTLQCNLHARDWYREAALEMETMRKKELLEEESLWQNQRKKFVEELKAELEDLR